MEIRSIDFKENDTDYVITNSTYTNSTIFLDIIIYDPDFDLIQEYEVFWYLDSGNGSFKFQEDLGNQSLVILPSYTSKGYRLKVMVRVFDGNEWSSFMNSSILEIVNSPPIITNLEYVFIENASLVHPTTRIDEFFVEDENIEIILNSSDNDFDLVYARIQWFRKLENGTWIEYTDYENETTIPSSITEAGDLWVTKITPYDGSDIGLPRNSTTIAIISRPVIHPDDIYFPDKSYDGQYNFTVGVSDYSNHGSLEVDFEINYPNKPAKNFSASSFGSNHWNLTINLLDYLDMNITVKIYVFTLHGQFKIFNYSSFSFTVQDKAPPRIEDFKISQNRINVTVEILLVEFGSHIREVILNYTIPNESSDSLVGRATTAFQSGYEMIHVRNESDGKFWFKVNIPNNFDPNVEVTFWIEVEDTRGNRVRIESEDVPGLDFEHRLGYTDDEIGIGDVLVAVAGTIGIFLLILGAVTLLRRRSAQKLALRTIVEDKLEFLTETYSILVTSAAGVPIWSLTNVIYRADESLTGLISGLSVSIDSFLESFQKDFVSRIADDSSVSDRQKKESMYKISAIEQNKVHILIVGSISYRIFIFSKDIATNFVRESFLNAIKSLQRELPLSDLGVIDEDILAPHVEKILGKHAPIGLLYPFKINISQLQNIDTQLKRGTTDYSISREGVDIIKVLVLAMVLPQSLKRNKQALLRGYDQFNLDHSAKFTRVILFRDAMKILDNIKDISIEGICDAFWSAVDENVRIILPQKNSKQ
jgi:hypothetical protein